MAIYIKPKWRRYIPHINIYLSIPLIRVQMMALEENFDMLTFTYLGVFWQIWKWEGKIRLFDNGNRFNSSMVKEDDVVGKRCGCWVSQKHSLKHFCIKHFSK